jgi:hypothetical protein
MLNICSKISPEFTMENVGMQGFEKGKKSGEIKNNEDGGH